MRIRYKKRNSALQRTSYLLLIAIIAIILVLSLEEKKAEKVIPVQEVQTLEVAVSTPQANVERLVESKVPSVELEAISTPEPVPVTVKRYTKIVIAEDELRNLAEIIYHEARGESLEGQQAVAEVILNRVIADNFPGTVHDVLHQGTGTSVPQFSTMRILNTADPLQAQYDAINAALYGPTILPADVVFFSRKGENDRVWGKIGGHVFCYQYNWD